MFEKFSLARVHEKKYDRTCHACVSYAYRKRKYEESWIDHEANMNIYVLMNVIHVERREISIIYAVYAFGRIIEIC